MRPPASAADFSAGIAVQQMELDSPTAKKKKGEGGAICI
jgi:hypothetical protein